VWVGFPYLIRAAIEKVKRIQGNITRISDEKIHIPDIQIPEVPLAGKQTLSREAVQIAARTIQEAAAANTFVEAVEIGYKGFGDIACTDEAREGISAFLEKRRPEFKK
jgi:enoyl-CoA hydratase/3-hydroxyacyl-CoA dehydrogenase